MTRVGRAGRFGGRGCLALVVLVMAAMLPGLGSAQAASGDFVVALGDSFSAGEGAPPFDLGTDRRAKNTCHRSPSAWPALVADRHHAQFLSLACSGAETLDVLKGDARSNQPERRISQLSRLADLASVDLVTLTIGGNDGGFATVLRDCVIGLVSCARHYGAGTKHDLAERVRGLRKPLHTVYRRVRKAAPGADLMVLGYPRLFPAAPERPTCAPSTISATEIEFLNARTTQLNRLIKHVSHAHGAIFVGVENAFEGHEIRCGNDPERMVNRLLEHGRVAYSFHPTALGYDSLADLAAPRWR